MLGDRLGLRMETRGEGIVVGSQIIRMPAFRTEEQQEDTLLDLKYALPTKAHGDAREKLLYMIVQDASPEGRPEMLDGVFREGLKAHLPAAMDELARTVMSDALRDAYWTKPDKNYYPIPFHSRIPLAFKLSRVTSAGKAAEARYKLFSGEILPFLCWDGADVNSSPIDHLFDLLASEDGFSLADRLMLQSAALAAPNCPEVASTAAAVAKLSDDVRKELVIGAFCQPALAQFQEDLDSVINLRDRLPRRDLVDMLTILLSLHLATYYYRLALILGSDLDWVVDSVDSPESAGLPLGSCACNCPLADCSLAGQIRFRVGTGDDRPVSMQDGCAIAFRDLDGKRLQPLSASIVTANVLQQLWAQLGGQAGRPRLRDLGSKLKTDAAFRSTFEAVASAAACVLACETELASDVDSVLHIAARRPGVFALREAILASRRKSLKYHARDVVNQLVKRQKTGGVLIRTRGRVQFFEVDEDMLFVLVAIVCKDREIPYLDFLQGLRRYGLAPQDAAERHFLADALERLGMLRRYSDAGESTYVRYVD